MFPPNPHPRAWLRTGLIVALLGLSACASLPKPSGPSGPSQRDLHLTTARQRAKLVIEVDRVEGVAPRPAALARFLQRAALYTDSPSGIDLVAEEVIPRDEWREGSAPLKALALRHRDLRPEAREHASLHVVYGPKWRRYRGYTWARGSMMKLDRDYDGSLIFLFSDSIKPVLWVTGVKQEASVLIHELGHAMGLATDPGHSSRAHCTVAHCLMYDGVDARTFALYFFPTLFTGYLPLDFCSACREDLWEDQDGVPPGLRAGGRWNGLLPEGRLEAPPPLASPSPPGGKKRDQK